MGDKEEAQIKYDKLNPPHDFTVATLGKPPLQSEMPKLRSTVSPTKNEANFPQLNIAEGEKESLMDLMHRNKTMWDSQEMRRVRRIFKGTDCDSSSIMSSSFDSIYSADSNK